MDAAIQNQSSNCDGDLDVGPNPLDEPDVLMNDSILEYVLNEPQEDASPLQASDARESYLAIVRSLYEIVGVDYPLDYDLQCNISSAAAGCCDGHVSSGDADADESGSASLLYQSTENDLHEQTIKYCGHVSNIGSFREAPGEGECSANCEVEEKSTKGSVNSEGIRFEDLNLAADCSGLYIPKNQCSANCEVKKKSTKGSANSESIRFEELNLVADYTGLSIPGKPLSTSDRLSKLAYKTRQREQSNPSAAHDFLYVERLLEICAEAVAVGDYTKANGTLHDLYHVHGISLQGNPLQRIAHYFCDALVARMAGMGGYQYKYMLHKLPPLMPITKVWYRLFPYLRITYYFANQSIVKAAEGSSRLHIVDFGIMYGIQWACLINALADRKGGPPLLVITAIGNSPPRQDSLQSIKETGQRLAAYSRLRKVPFQFHAVDSADWLDIDAASLQIQDSELLIVNSVMRLRHLPDESPDLKSPVPSRQKFFMILRSLNPHLLVAADSSASCNSPFFVSRFREAFRFYHGLADTLDTVAGGGDADWLFTEQRFCARDILNIVACEGAERIQRLENYKQWDAHISRAGFELLPIPSTSLSTLKSYVTHEYHQNFIVHREARGWILVGWKGRPVVAMSTWRSRPHIY